MLDKFNTKKKSTMRLETLRKTLDKKGNPTNKTRFINGEPFKLSPFGAYYRYISSSFGEGHLVQIYTGSDDTCVLFEQHESNVLKIGPTTCKAFMYVLGNRVNTCLRFNSMSFEVKLEEKYFEENNIERIKF